MGVIDGAHISIARPQRIHVVDYYHKPGRYSIVAQVVVDCNKRLIYVVVGLLGSINGSRVLCKFGSHKPTTIDSGTAVERPQLGVHPCNKNHNGNHKGMGTPRGRKMTKVTAVNQNKHIKNEYG
ncbi:unnamed protein product, partial [Sphagnum balticum]